MNMHIAGAIEKMEGRRSGRIAQPAASQHWLAREFAGPSTPNPSFKPRAQQPASKRKNAVKWRGNILRAVFDSPRFRVRFHRPNIISQTAKRSVLGLGNSSGNIASACQHSFITGW
jgi:hypothetical protein